MTSLLSIGATGCGAVASRATHLGRAVQAAGSFPIHLSALWIWATFDLIAGLFRAASPDRHHTLLGRMTPVRRSFEGIIIHALGVIAPQTADRLEQACNQQIAARAHVYSQREETINSLNRSAAVEVIQGLEGHAREEKWSQRKAEAVQQIIIRLRNLDLNCPLSRKKIDFSAADLSQTEGITGTVMRAIKNKKITPLCEEQRIKDQELLDALRSYEDSSSHIEEKWSQQKAEAVQQIIIRLHNLDLNCPLSQEKVDFSAADLSQTGGITGTVMRAIKDNKITPLCKEQCIKDQELLDALRSYEDASSHIEDAQSHQMVWKNKIQDLTTQYGNHDDRIVRKYSVEEMLINKDAYKETLQTIVQNRGNAIADASGLDLDVVGVVISFLGPSGSYVKDGDDRDCENQELAYYAAEAEWLASTVESAVRVSYCLWGRETTPLFEISNKAQQDFFFYLTSEVVHHPSAKRDIMLGMYSVLHQDELFASIKTGSSWEDAVVQKLFRAYAYLFFSPLLLMFRTLNTLLSIYEEDKKALLTLIISSVVVHCWFCFFVLFPILIRSRLFLLCGTKLIVTYHSTRPVQAMTVMMIIIIHNFLAIIHNLWWEGFAASKSTMPLERFASGLLNISYDVAWVNYAYFHIFKHHVLRMV